jgi:DNA-binding GntR family transcriptional regulator
MRLTDSRKAYLQIREKVIKVELPPGSVIDESSLMKELSLGRTPIREAIKLLQAENLVVITPRRGMYVSDIAITDLVQIHEVRIEVEANCARLAAKRITPVQIEEVCQIVSSEQDMERHDMDSLIALDRQFHSFLARATNNKFLFKDWENYYNLSLRIWYLILNYLEPKDVGVEDHIQIMAAIKEGNVDKVDHLMRQHIIHFYDTVKRTL